MDDLDKIAQQVIMHKGLKADIKQIGNFDENDQPVNWIMDCKNYIPAFNINKNGDIFYGGYSIEELKQIRFKEKCN